MAVDITIKNPISLETDVDNHTLGERWTSLEGFLEVEDSDGNIIATYTPGYWLSAIKCVEDD